MRRTCVERQLLVKSQDRLAAPGCSNKSFGDLPRIFWQKMFAASKAGALFVQIRERLPCGRRMPTSRTAVQDHLTLPRERYTVVNVFAYLSLVTHTGTCHVCEDLMVSHDCEHSLTSMHGLVRHVMAWRGVAWRCRRTPGERARTTPTQLTMLLVPLLMMLVPY